MKKRRKKVRNEKGIINIIIDGVYSFNNGNVFMYPFSFWRRRFIV